MTPLEDILELLGWCQHEHSRRERDGAGVLWLVCDRCNRKVEALRRTDAERTVLAEHYPPVRPAVARKDAR